MATFTERMIRAARLDAAVYEEIEADSAAIGPAMAVVILSSIAAGIGSVQVAQTNIIVTVLAALLGWYVWAFLTYFIGTRLLPEPQTEADVGQLLRTIGFATAPGILRVLGIIPGLTNIVFLVTNLWILAAMVVAVRQALDYESTGRAVGVCLIGWLIQMVILSILISLAGGPQVLAPEAMMQG